mmetsp:Transcript_86227/g.230290  ORF Transcript_86227/g.230290 Transcript_86227/m.230290 type:complete len:124 (+) Transcript_86227:343-714(+)
MKNFTPVIVLSQDDFHRMTKKGTLCDEEGCLTPEQFDSILRDELERHLESKIAEAYELAQNFNKTDLSALFGGLKILRLMAKLRKSSSPETSKELVAARALWPEGGAGTRVGVGARHHGEPNP